MIGAVGAVGAAVGPINGGLFTTFISWRWAFRTELVIVLIVLVLVRYLKPDQQSPTRERFDFAGAILSIVGWSSIVLGILLAQKYGFFLAKEPYVLAGLEFAPFGLSITPVMIGLGFVVILLLFRWESHLEERGMDGLFKPSLFKIPGLIPAFISRFIQVGITAAFLYIVPLLLQLSFEFTAIQTGIALMPFSLSLLVLAIVGARLSAGFFANRIIQVGFILALAGLGTVDASIQILDWYHAKAHLVTTAHSLHGEGTAASQQWLKTYETYLYQGHARKIADHLLDLAQTYPEAAPALTTEAGYFHKHHRRMRYMQ